MKLLRYLLIGLFATNGFAYGQEFHHQTSAEDKRGNVIEIRNYDVDGKLVNSKEGHAIIKWKYDKRNNKILQAYYDKNENLTVDNLGVAMWKYKFDKNNNKVYQGHYGIDGKLLAPNPNIVHSEWYWKYDKNGTLISTKTKNKN